MFVLFSLFLVDICSDSSCYSTQHLQDSLVLQGRNVGDTLRGVRLGLSGDASYSLPSTPLGVHDTRGAGDQTGNRDVHHTVVDQTDTETRIPGHGAVDGVTREHHAVDGVGGVGGH
jgi:hypothetical protein